MKLCIIGGTGQQGYQQVLAGLEQGHEVVAVGQSRALSHQAKLKNENLKCQTDPLQYSAGTAQILTYDTNLILSYYH